MKNTLKTIGLFSVFAISGILFQISCSNSDNDNQIQNVTQTNKILYLKGTVPISLWICDYNGANQTQIPITLPSNIEISWNTFAATPRLSPDGSKVFFIGKNTTTNSNSIFSCDISGNNVQEIVSANTTNIEIGGVN
jgi:hypothetical protein